MNTPFLSVIIPIYKVEDYLERCVKSVLNQDFKDIEVILVDDGSPDRCPQICDEFAKTDERIKVLHKPNGGLSSARNAGIEMAVGEYLAFLDSDDQWVDGALKPLLNVLKESKAEMLMFRSQSLYPDGTIMRRNDGELFKKPLKVYGRIDLYNVLINSGNMHEQAGTHFLNTNFIRNNSLFFKEGILGEDTEWMFRVMRMVSSIAVSDILLQTYTEKRLGSITNTCSVKSLRDLIFVIQESIDYYKCHSHLDVCKYELAQCSYLWSIALGYYSLLPHSEAKEFKRILKQQCKQLPLTTHPKSRMVGRVYSILGFYLTSKILSLYMNLHNRNLVNAKAKVNE